MFFSGITPKILTFEYYAKNKTYSEVNFICVYQFGQNLLRNARQKAKMDATRFSSFVISTSDRGDFPRIIVIDLLYIFFNTTLQIYRKNKDKGKKGNY